MKTYSIFKKNLKTVSRNWSYFFVLLVCPAILILVAGGMLNSFDTNHIYIGLYDPGGDFCEDNFVVYDSESDSPIKIDLQRFHCYDELSRCVDAVTTSKIGACMHVIETEDSYIVNVYLDSSRRLVEYYSKQLILQEFLGEQASLVQETSEEMAERIYLYSLALVEVRGDLLNTKNDLIEQENLLIDRQQKLRGIKSDFDLVYSPLKELEPEINLLRDQLVSNSYALSQGIQAFEYKKVEIENRINNLKYFLSSRLGSSDYNYVENELNSLLNDLEELDSALDNINAVQQNQDLIDALNMIISIIPKIDEVNNLLIQTDQDLTLAISKTRESGEKVDEYIVGLDLVTKDLEEFKSRVGAKSTVLNFEEGNSITQDPVLLSFPLLVSIIITFTSLILSNLFILRSVNRPSYFRELISPSSDSNFLVADYLVNLLFIFVQSIVLFLVGVYWIGIPFYTVYSFFFSICLTSSLFIFIGISLGYLIKSQSLSMLLTIFLVMLFLIISDLLIPVTLISPSIRFFVQLNPFVLLSNLLKTLFVLDRPLSESSYQFIILGFFLFFSAILTYVSRKINKSRIRD